MVPPKQSPERRDDPLIESEMIGLVGMLAALLLVFALGYLIVYPNHAQPGYSAMYWNQTPSLSGLNEKPIILFSVELESHELSVSRYTMKAYVEEKIVAYKIVDLNANHKQEISFTVPVAEDWLGKKQIKVTAQKIVDSNTQKSAPVLELIDWVDVNG